MAMIFFDGQRFRPITMARRSASADLYICCPGPSLADSLATGSLTGPGVATLAVNRAYPGIAAPTMWIGTDHPSCFDAGLMWETFPKFLRMCWREQAVFGTQLKGCPATYFVDVDKNRHPLDMFDARQDNIGLIAPAYNSFEAALHLAIWMGYRRIHLVGCDFGGKSDYYDDKQLTPQQRGTNRRLYNDLVHRLIHHAVEAKLRGMEIVSCTQNSPINTFLPYVPLPEAVKASHERVPKGWAPCLDARDAFRCRWNGPGEEPRGVVVGVIEDHAWMLEWWHTNFRKHNPDLPVAFADFGISKRAADWCDEHGTRFVVNCPERVEGWFRKPFAILQAPFRKILWLDLDTEIRGPLAPFFDYITPDNLVICGVDEVLGPHYGTSHDHGWFLMLPNVNVDLCSGMVGVMRGNPHIQEWAVNSVPPREHTYKGDHEILGVLIHRRNPPLHRIKGEEYTLVRFPASPDPAVLHHAGLQGKATLRERLIRDGGGGETIQWAANSLMGAEELIRLLELIDSICAENERPSILEIGVSRGGTALEMLRRVQSHGKTFRYVGVDTRLAWRPFVHPAAFEGSQLTMITKDSAQAKPDVEQAAPGGFDLVIVDGCHCQNCAEQDVALYAPLVKPGGHLAFHDCGASRQNPGERQPGTSHVGVLVRPTYLSWKDNPAWEDCGEVGTECGIGILRRKRDATASD